MVFNLLINIMHFSSVSDRPTGRRCLGLGNLAGCFIWSAIFFLIILMNILVMSRNEQRVGYNLSMGDKHPGAVPGSVTEIVLQSVVEQRSKKLYQYNVHDHHLSDIRKPGTTK